MPPGAHYRTLTLLFTTQTFVYAGFIALPVVMAAVVVWGARSASFGLIILTWMVLVAALALSGMLNQFGAAPPPVALLIIGGLAGTIVVGRSGLVRRLIDLPWAALIGAQAFRILVEILIHSSSTIGLAPRQMTWSGYNFDVFTGLTALALAPFANRAPRWVIVLWNCLGLVLLINVVGIAALSFPTRFQLLRPDNTWVASFPYVWLPTVLVPAALLGHIVVFRKLTATRAGITGSI